MPGLDRLRRHLLDLSTFYRPWVPPARPAAADPEGPHVCLGSIPHCCAACRDELACTGRCGGVPRPPRYDSIFPPASSAVIAGVAVDWPARGRGRW